MLLLLSFVCRAAGLWRGHLEVCRYVFVKETWPCLLQLQRCARGEGRQRRELAEPRGVALLAAWCSEGAAVRGPKVGAAVGQ